MKKTISVILAAVMIFMFVPFFAFAAEDLPTITQTDLAAKGYNLYSGDKFAAAENLTVPANATLHISNNATLVIPEGKALNILGDIVVHAAGELIIDGAVYNADKITGEGRYVAKLEFPALEEYGLEGIIEVSYASSFTGNQNDDLKEGALTYYPVDPDGATVYAPLNQYIYIVAHIIEPIAGIDKYDDSLMMVRLNGVIVPYSQGNHNTLLSTGGKISYSTWTNEDAFLSTFKIDLPVKEGATVIGRGGEMSADGEIVYIKYGQPFSFRVDVDPSYSKSPYEVYIVSGYGWTNMDMNTILEDLVPAQPDADGYYTIPEVKSDYTVFVVGLVSNQVIDTVSNIFEQIKSILDIIKKFFESFLELFGITL